MKNLDLIAAQTAQIIIKETKTFQSNILDASKVENLITKALGVLQENGVYAATLYLYSRTEKSEQFIARETRKKLLDLIADLEPNLSPVANNEPDRALKYLTDNVCNNLDRLLLVKQLWEQTLIYARYGAKARSAAEDTKS